MKGKITWCTLGGMFSLDEVTFDTTEISVRDKLMKLLTNEWELFGDPGDVLEVRIYEGEE